MKTVFVRVLTAGNNVLYYTGKAGKDWITEDITEAFEYSEQAANIRIEQFRRTYEGTGLRFELGDKPSDVYFSLVDNCGDEIVGHQRRGGLSLAKRLEVVADLARRYSRKHGQGRVVVRDAKTWQVIENLELPA